MFCTSSRAGAHYVLLCFESSQGLTDILCCHAGRDILQDSVLKSDEELHQLHEWKGLWGWQ